MRSNTLKFLFGFLIIFILLAGSFSGGFLVGQSTSLFNSKSSSDLVSSSSKSKSEELDQLFQPFWEAWNYVDENYVDQPVDQTKMMQGAIEGMLNSLDDPHTSYMNPDMYRQQSTPLQGEYDGIGAWVDLTGEFLTIISPMPNSPAEKNGLKPEDQVIAVDGEDVTGLSGELVLRKILGKAGTDVTLTIYRHLSESTFDVTITRQKIEIPSVTSKMLENKIAYVQLANFGEKTHEELKKQLKELLNQDPIGLILDLRYNGGGYLTAAIEVSSEFVSENPIMYEVFGDGNRLTYNAKPLGIATKIPLIVLINEGSASASEITAGAIQDHDRGILVGTQSYGKGSVQNWINLADDQGAIRVTIARWLTPNERQINELGLTPDYIIEITEDDIKNEIDPQLNKAIELLETNKN
jgi:carboxyl-terminal processing protease